MKVVIQRVKKAKVSVKNKEIASIDRGYLILLGVSKESVYKDIEHLTKKIANLRIFEDENGKMNLNIKDVGGEILLISQFTLYADTKKGNRPSFTKAMEPEKAKKMYEEFARKLNDLGINVKTGIFGARMEVSLINDGPVTIIIGT
jgi:D-tyrosyl-tRNA(Tyr) deacylase